MIDAETESLLRLIHTQSESVDHRRSIESLLQRNGKKMMMLSSGRMVDVSNLWLQDIDMTDIMRSLFHMNRYAGHTGYRVYRDPVAKDDNPYEVAKNGIFYPKSYNVGSHAMLLQEIMGSMHAPAEACLWGLIHDFSEAYVTDVPRDLKMMPNMAWFREIEEKVQGTIVRALFGEEFADSILDKANVNRKLAEEFDKEICLGLEMPYLMNHRRAFERDFADVTDDELGGVIYALMYRCSINFPNMNLYMQFPEEPMIKRVRNLLLGTGGSPTDFKELIDHYRWVLKKG